MLSEKTKKFIESVKALIESGEVKNYAEIIKALEWNKTIFSSVINGRKNVPHDIYKKFTEVYHNEQQVNFLPEVKQKNNDNDTLATIRDIARSNVTLADANKVLADNNSDLIGLLKKANSAPALQDTGAFLFPYLQRIALGGVGKFWKDVGAGLEELSNILHEYPADKIKSHN